MGVVAYLARTFITDEMIAALPKEQQAEFLTEHPSWYTASFAFAVFGGVLGAIFLLLRKKQASTLFIISALGAIVQHIYIFMNIEVFNYIMPIMIMVVCVFFVWYSKDATKKGVLT